jgi:Terminase large subunit, T4likevirus-type, N-terminal
MKKEKRILWQPNEGPQTAFLSCPAREVLFGGAAGSGKTDALLMSAVSQVNNKNHRALILRRAFPMLRDLVLNSHELFPPLGATFNKQENVWTFPSKARVEFGFLDAPEDVYRYMGRAFSFIGWDELTTWPGDSVDAQGQPVNGAYVYMLSRLRAVKGSGLLLEIRATCTPGGIGHSWVKTRWQIPDDGSSTEVVDPQTGYRRVFIRATITDNPHQTKDYERNLWAQPEARRKALLEGQWNVFEGAVFSEWNHSLHVCEPFDVPSEWEIWRGGDDGFAAPAAILWFAYDEIHDRVYVVNELYRSGLTAEALAEAILTIDKRYGGNLDGVIDSASFANVGMGVSAGGGSRGDVMNRCGCGWQPCEKGEGSRIAGKSQIHNRLALKPDGYPGLIVFKTCRNLIRTLPTLVYDNRHKEDVDSAGEDHLYDCMRYGLTRRRWNTCTSPAHVTDTTLARARDDVPLAVAGRGVPSRVDMIGRLTTDGVGPRGEPPPRSP